MKIYTDRIRDRLEQLVMEVNNARSLVYYERLRAFRDYCNATPALTYCLIQLPQPSYDFKADWRELEDRWPEGEASYAYRWDAIRQAVDGQADNKDLILAQLGSMAAESGFTEAFVIPLYHYLIDQLKASTMMLYLLVRYKRWAEWFEAAHLREVYRAGGEEGLDSNLRQFLFESGLDYPFSKPRSPHGEADVVAGLETDDPLVLEIKVWDSEKGYKEDRVRDGLRQVMDYAAKYGKDKGYVAVFNLDPEPLEFVSEANAGEWPARIEQGRTYYFIEIDIAEQEKPVSQRDKGRPVKKNQVRLRELGERVEHT